MTERIMRENLVTLAQCYATAKNWSLATVSKEIHGNQAFLTKYMAAEVSPTVETYFRMMNFLRDNWPKGHKRPQLRTEIPIWESARRSPKREAD